VTCTNNSVPDIYSQNNSLQYAYRDYFQFFRLNAALEAKSQAAETLARANKGNDHLSTYNFACSRQRSPDQLPTPRF